jgi:NADH-quinone oxidoreductase subunit J
MTWPFALIAAVTLGSAIAALSLRNLVHCALCLTVTFAGLAALYLQLDAEFVGFAQVLVYVGAVAILLVFAILLTRGGDTAREGPVVSPGAWVGVGVAVVAFLSLATAMLASRAVPQFSKLPPAITVKQIGEQLLSKSDKSDNYVLPLEVLGLLLTAALVGAVLIAMQERKGPK